MAKKKNSDAGEFNPYVKLGASLGGILLVVILFVFFIPGPIDF